MKRGHLNLSAKIISVLYIILLTMFAFDEKIFSLGFIMHLVPTIILTGCLITAWFKPKHGGILFIIVGIATVFAFNTYENWLTLVTISIIPVISGVLFWLSKKH